MCWANVINLCKHNLMRFNHLLLIFPDIIEGNKENIYF